MNINKTRMRELVFTALISLSLLVVSCKSGDQEGLLDDGKSIAKEHVDKYSNGVVKSVARYEGDKLSGVQEFYNKKGELQNTMLYVNGIQEGESIIYYADGGKYRVTPYINDAINGERKKFRKDGRVWSTQTFKDGMPENDLKEYGESGKLKSIPEMMVKKVSKNGKVLVSLSVKGKHKRVKYFKGVLKDGKFFDKSSSVLVEDQNKSKASFTLDSTNMSYDIIAQVTTQADNHLFLIKRVTK